MDEQAGYAEGVVGEAGFPGRGGWSGFCGGVKKKGGEEGGKEGREGGWEEGGWEEGVGERERKGRGKGREKGGEKGGREEGGKGKREGGRGKGRGGRREEGGDVLGTPAAWFALFVEPGTGGAGVVGEGIGLDHGRDHGLQAQKVKRRSSKPETSRSLICGWRFCFPLRDDMDIGRENAG